MNGRRPSRAAAHGALHRIVQAVYRNDWAAYNAAIAAAKAIGCTPDQIEDAYRFPAAEMGLRRPSFDIYGRII